jgi:CRP-like cAMP-binding protein
MIDFLDKRFLLRLTLRPRTILLKEGEMAGQMYFIQSGCIRSWLNNEGREITLQFFFEEEPVTALDSFLNQTLSTVYIETVEACDVYVIKREDFIGSLDNERFRNWFYENAVKKLLVHHNRLISLLKNKPAERYRQLQADHPNIIKRIPQHYIASYLGITSVSLSRIRNRLKG